MRRLLLLALLCLPLMGQTLQEVTLQSVSVGDVAVANESVYATESTGVSAPAGNGYWRCTNYAEANGNDCAGDVNDTGASAESWQSYDGDAVCSDEAGPTLTEEVRFDFDTPSSSPTATANAQAIRITFDRSGITCGYNGIAQDDPTVDVYVWDGDSLEILVNDLDCDTDNAGDQEYTYPWTYEGGSDGSEVYVQVFDNGNGLSGSGQRRCAVEYVEWYASVQ